jgi:hypothetical protein
VEDRERNGKLSPEIFVYATNKNFLNIYDALRIEKIKIEIAGYDPATNRQTGHAAAWLDVNEARLLAHMVSFRLFKGVAPNGRWEKFGGSQRDDGTVESRLFTLEWDEGEGGKFARMPYRMTIANGPGERTDMGAVKPKGEPTSRLSLRLNEADAMKIMLAVKAYIEAYEAAHHHRIVADRMRELNAKMAERSGQSQQSMSNAPSRTPAPTPRPAAAAQPAPAARPALRAMPGGGAASNSGNEINRGGNTRTARAG